MDSGLGTASRSYVVEQGPRWLADLLYGPPGWLVALVVLTALLAAAGALAGYRRNGLDDETVEGIAFNLTVLLAVGGAVLLFRDHAELPYLADAGFGLAIGYLVAIALRRYCYRPLLEDRDLTEGAT